MGGRSTLLLLILVGALVAGIYWTEGVEEDRPVLTVRALGERSFAHVARITVQRGEATPIVLERGGVRGYRVLEPLRDDASRARMLAVRDAWNSAELVAIYGPGTVDEDLAAQLGLSPPALRVEFVFEDGERREFEIGSEGPLGTELFVRLGETVYHGGKALRSVIEGNVDDFRERQVFFNEPGNMHRLELRRRQEDHTYSVVRLERGREGLRLTAPIETAAHQGSAHSFVANLLGLSVQSFVAGNTGLGPMAEPSFVIEVDGAAGSESLQLWREGEFMIRGHLTPRDLDFTFEARNVLPALQASVEALRSRLMNPFAPDELTEVVVDPGAGVGSPLVLRRGRDELLRLEGPIRSEADPSVVTQLLDALSRFGAESFVEQPSSDPSAYGLEEGAVGIELVGPMRQRRVEVALGRAADGAAYARRAGETHVARIAADVADVLARPWYEYVHKQVHRQAVVFDIRRVTYSKGGVERRFIKDDDGKWAVEGGGAAPPDFASLVSETLADLRGTAVLDGERDDLPEPLVIELARANGMALVVFELYQGVPGEADTVLVRNRQQPRLLYRLRVLEGAQLLAPFAAASG